LFGSGEIEIVAPVSNTIGIYILDSKHSIELNNCIRVCRKHFTSTCTTKVQLDLKIPAESAIKLVSP
jgi:hypothetical protein